MALMAQNYERIITKLKEDLAAQIKKENANKKQLAENQNEDQDGDQGENGEKLGKGGAGGQGGGSQDYYSLFLKFQQKLAQID